MAFCAEFFLPSFRFDKLRLVSAIAVSKYSAMPYYGGKEVTKECKKTNSSRVLMTKGLFFISNFEFEFGVTIVTYLQLQNTRP